MQRLLDSLAAHNRHQARTAVLIMWRTGLRASEVLELEWRDLDYSGEPPTLLVRKSKNRRARTVRLHRELVQLFTNWPASRSPRDKVVSLSMRTALRHIGDGIRWAGLDEESPGTGRRRAEHRIPCVALAQREAETAQLFQYLRRINLETRTETPILPKPSFS